VVISSDVLLLLVSILAPSSVVGIGVKTTTSSDDFLISIPSLTGSATDLPLLVVL